MVANALVTTRVSSEVKKEASKVLEAVGLTVSDAMRIFLTTIAREHILSFNEIIPNKITLEAINDARAGKLHSADTIEEFRERMNEED
jgi:DNA-damage-inducible protein J